MATADVSGPLFDLEDLARALGLKPRSVHQAIARGRIPKPHNRLARGALAWTATEAEDVVAVRILEVALPAGFVRRLAESETLVAKEYARRLAALVLEASQRP